MPKISVGRSEEDRKEHGLEGTGIIGKHLVGENEEAHKANPIYFDLAKPHVMGVFGKRGTGKCMLPDEKVLTDQGLKTAESLFREASEEGRPEIEKRDEQLYNFSGPKVQSVSDSFEATENRVVAGYRKKVDEELYRVETASGREITVTGEHPLLTASGWENTDNLSEGQKVGVPRQTSIEFTDQKLDVPEEFEKADYSSRNRRENSLIEEGHGSLSQESDGTGSFQRMASRAEDKGLVELDSGSFEATEKGVQVLQERKTSEHYRLGKSRPVKLPEKSSPELARFMAFLIAEGHEQKITDSNYRIIFTNNEQEFLDEFQSLGKELFDIKFRKMDENSVYSNSRALEIFLKENGYPTGENSFDKDIPGFVTASSRETVRNFLRTYYDCEGNVTDQQIELTTASRDVAEKINYMLLRFGIVGRTTEKQKYASNTEEQKVRTYYQVTVSGGRDLSRFRDRIGFELGRKQQKLEKIVKDENTNVDTVPAADLLQKAREHLGADRTQIADYKQSLKAYEEGKCRPSRGKLQEFINSLKEYRKKIEGLKDRIKEEPDVDDIEKLVEESGVKWKEVNRALGYDRSDRRFLEYQKYRENPGKLAEPVLGLFEEKHDLEEAKTEIKRLEKLASSDVLWDEVTGIEKIDYEGWVYDLTVENDHSFTAGFGGIISHNSYSMGTIAEELQGSSISDNLSTIIIDSMGIYWSMKRPNDRAAGMLEEWDMNPEAFDAKIYIPEGRTDEFEEKDMPYDNTFTIDPSELSAQDWAMAFDIEMNSEMGILLERAISELDDRTDGSYSLNHIKKAIKKFDFDESTVKALENRFMTAEEWGVFGEESSLDQFTTRGEMSVVDVSMYDELVRGLIVGLLGEKILRERMAARRMEELDEMQGLDTNEMPIVWMFIDEAHEFIPNKGRTPATDTLLRWVKIGREPGVSLVMATQQPAKLHPNALSQCDILLSHRLTAKQDIDALGEIMQTYMRHDLKHYIDALPDRVGTGLILDDNSERVYPVQMRPRKSWHAGGTPDAFED
ncbi:MAG: LAGLIDADG family homing endonuclease [Candidatus Nanohaloarchaea archaeon]